MQVRMSIARPVFQNINLMLTRRVRGGLFFLRPCKHTNQVIRYVLAVMANTWKIQLHAVTALSNHWHVCATDPLGNIVDFQRDCHTFITRALNARFGEVESMWSNTQGSRVETVEPDDLIDKIAYTMANPVEAGLVRHGKSWPGVRHAWPRKEIKVAMPAMFFRGKEDGGKWPEMAELTFTRPPGYDELSDDELEALIADAIHTREEKVRREYDAAGRKFLGRKAVLAQNRHAKPNKQLPRFNLSPKIACRDEERRIERLLEHKQWQVDYEAAREQWRAGDRAVIFPYGTYKMRVEHGACCGPAPN
jgi:putative transposase